MSLFKPYVDRWIIIGFLVFMISSILMWLALDKISARIKQDIGENLQTVLDTTYNNINRWSEHHFREAYHYANLPETVELVKAQLRLPTDKKTLMDSPYLKEMRDNFRSSLIHVQSVGFFVISPDEINIVSLRDGNLAKVNLLAGRGKYLANIFEGESQLVLPVRSDIPLPDVTGNLIEDQPTMFIGVPVYDQDGSVIAAFTTRVDPALHFTQFTQIARIGETGETYAFNEYGELITRTRFADQLVELGLSNPNDGGVLSVKLLDPGFNMLSGYRPDVDRQSLPLTKMAQQAISGHNGLDLDGYRDYRGVKVIGAWRWIDQLNFGLAVEIDVAEVYRSLDIIRRTVITSMGVSVILFLCLAFAIISRNRKLDAEITERKKTEVELNKHRESLEELVGQRTRYLEHEIEERKRAEDSLRTSVIRRKAILDASIDPLIISDMQGIIQSASDSVQGVFGWQPDELIGRNVNILMPEPYYSVHNRKIDLYHKSARPHSIAVPREYQAVRKDGSPFPCEVTVTRVDIPGQDEPMFTGIIRDLTEQKSAEQEKNELQAQLFQTQKMEAMGTLAGGVAHDFNNILTSVLGYTELAGFQVPENSPAVGSLHEIKRAAKRAADLVQQILTFSRHEKSSRVPVDLSKLIKEALNFLRPVLPSTIEVRNTIKTANCMIVADPTRIHQVLMNLCTNASAAMRDSGGLLELTLDEIEVTESSQILPPGPYVEFCIRDSGEGIQPSIIDRIFDPFFTTKEVGEGTGLGLSVVHSIIKDHHGSIRVDSKPGVGTTFTIMLPVGEIAQQVDQSAMDIPYGGTERILYVDDEEMITQVNKKLLESIGYTVVETNSSLKALDIFASKPDDFDVIITDQTMPGMTGDQLVEEILAIRPDLPIILCSGFSERIDEEKAHELGVRHYLSKPTSLNTLGATIRSIFDEV